MEVRELLSFYQYDGDNTPIILGSALGALNGEAKWEEKVMELMDAVDYCHRHIDRKTTVHELPFQPVPTFQDHPPYPLYSGIQRFSERLPDEPKECVHGSEASDHQ